MTVYICELQTISDSGMISTKEKKTCALLRQFYVFLQPAILPVFKQTHLPVHQVKTIICLPHIQHIPRAYQKQGAGNKCHKG